MTGAAASRTRVNLWLAAWLLCWVSSFILTHIPIPRGLHLPSGGDKVGHVALYMCITLTGGGSLYVRKRLTRSAILAWAGVYLAYGVLDEWLQSFVNRTASVEDWIANAVGVALASTLLLVLAWRSTHAAGSPSAGRM